MKYKERYIWRTFLRFLFTWCSHLSGNRWWICHLYGACKNFSVIGFFLFVQMISLLSLVAIDTPNGSNFSISMNHQPTKREYIWNPNLAQFMVKFRIWVEGWWLSKTMLGTSTNMQACQNSGIVCVWHRR